MHPALFLGAWVLLGATFALQDWMSMHLWSERVHLGLLLEAWCVEYFIWGALCWLLWMFLGPRIHGASVRCMFTWVLPLSIAVSILEEMIWVLCFPNLPLKRPHMSYWHRLGFDLTADLTDNLVIFWCTFALFRGIGYYRQLREKEAATAELKAQLANAQVRALRMQLNPHFLFNSMNSISSLIQVNPASADIMLEQLSSLLRITLERGEAQLIPLSDEMQFIEMYLAMQDVRFTGRIRQEISVEPELLDALVPAMLLQPLIENAYVHGLSRIQKSGVLVVAASRQNSALSLRVSNSGAGIQSRDARRTGVGLANVRDRLRLHYGDNQTCAIEELEDGVVQVTITLPLEFTERPMGTLTGYGVS